MARIQWKKEEHKEEKVDLGAEIHHGTYVDHGGRLCLEMRDPEGDWHDILWFHPDQGALHLTEYANRIPGLPTTEDGTIKTY